MINNDTKFLIVGLGLLGGSYAMGLSKRGYYVTAINRSQQAIDYALENGLIQKGSAFVDEALIKEADIIIFGLYPKTEIQWIQENQHLFRSGTLLTDVSGVKSGVVDTIQAFLREDVEFISVHPMAGREFSGVQYANDAIFKKANYIVVPTEKNTSQAISTAYQLGSILQFANISQLSMEKHDEIIGFVSQLTHIIAVALMTCNTDEKLQDYTGDSFRDLTRIARINENMWSELFIDNKEALLKQIDCFMATMKDIRDMIQQEKVEQLKNIMRYSTERRALFDKKE